MQKILFKLFQPITFILIGVFARILPHPANFTPIAAMALFGGTYMSKKQALIIPLIIMLTTDIFIGFDSLSIRLSVYGSFLATILIGFWLKDHKDVRSIIFAALSSSLLFFIITNLFVWAFGTMYSKTISGLAECYFFAIPFFKNTILGDLTYSGLFFGGFEFVKNFKTMFKKSLI